MYFSIFRIHVCVYYIPTLHILSSWGW